MSAALDNNNNWYHASFDEGRQALRHWREENARRSEEVVEIWEHVLSRKPAALGDELWVVFEQVFIAALDCGRLDVAEECITALHNKFPKSHRVIKLEAMRFESIGKFDQARQLYDSLIKKDEPNAIYHKRKIAVFKAEGNVADAILALNDYLAKFMNDSEAWIELSELYLAEQDYARAAFCYEELILSNPHNHLYHQRYAEIKYTQGGFDNLELAKSYFSQSAKLNPNNMRALFGLFQSCAQLLVGGKLTGQKRKECAKVATWAVEEITQRYGAEAFNSPEAELQLKIVEKMLNSLNVAIPT